MTEDYGQHPVDVDHTAQGDPPDPPVVEGTVLPDVAAGDHRTDRHSVVVE